MHTDAIGVIGQHLSGDARLAAAVAGQLLALRASGAYAAWAGSCNEAEPFELRDGVGCDVGLLRHVGLVDGRNLLAKVNAFAGRVFVTDGVWIDPRHRVFPFCDESEALVRHVREAGSQAWADWVVDLATGCGHNVIGLGSRGLSVALDVNPRALDWLHVNRALNGMDSLRSALNDIRHGIPSDIAAAMRGRILFLANMPFAPSPAKAALPLTSDGGHSGADLQLASFNSIARFAARAGSSCTIKASLMSMSVGDARSERWETVELARQVFGERCVRWSLLRHERLMRVDGVREIDNPAPLRVALARFAACRLYTPEAGRRAWLRDEYARLALQHEGQGNPDIALGVIDIDLNPGVPT